MLGVLLAPVCVLAAGRPLPPDPELLEFLGSFATASGKAVDPMLFAAGEKSASSGKRSTAAPTNKKRPRMPKKTTRKDHADDE